MSSSKFVVDAETAAADFERFCEFAKVDFDRPRDANDTKDLADSRREIEYFIRRGRVTVDDQGMPAARIVDTNLPEGPEEIKFTRMPKGSMLGAADRVKKNSENGKMIAMMADAAGIPSQLFYKLEWRDLEVAMAVFALFLA